MTSHIEVPNPSVGEQGRSAPAVSVARPRIEDDLDAVLSRPVFISSVNFPLTMASPPAVSTGILSSFLSNAAVAARLSYVRHFKATVCVRLEMPANPHMYGEAHCSLMPVPASGNANFYASRYYQNPVSGVFNANTGNPVVLKYPYMYQRRKLPTYSGAADVAAYCQLVVAPLSPLGRDDAVAVGTPAMNIYVWLEDVELSDTTPYLAYGPAVAGEPSPGVFSYASNRVAAAARSLVPLVPQMAPVAAAADAAGAVGAWFGWSKPNAPNKADNTLLRRTGFHAQGIGRGQATVLALDPEIVRPLNPGLGTESEDVLAFEFWARKWGWLGQASYATTTSAGTILAAIPVTPFVMDSTNSVLAPVAMCALASERWIGSMEYRVTIAATPYHRGKLMLAYIPSTLVNSVLTLSQLLTTTHNVVFDVSQAVDVAVTVGWTQNTNCAVVAFSAGVADLAHSNLPDSAGFPLTASYAGSLLGPTYLSETNGQLVLLAFDPLSATAAGSLAVNLWVRGGPDLQFGGSGGSSVNQAIAYGPASAHDFEQAAPQQGDRPRGYWLGGDAIAPGTVAAAWGDENVSFRPLLKRMTPMYAFTPWSTTSTSISTAVSALLLKFPLPAYPPVPRLTQPLNFLSLGSATNTVNGVYYGNMFGMLQASFAGLGGGMNHHIALEPYAPLGAVNIMAAASQADTMPGSYAGLGGTSSYPIRFNTGTDRWGDNWPGEVSSTLARWGCGMEWGRVGPNVDGNLTLIEVATKHPSESLYELPSSGAQSVQAPFGFELCLFAPAGAALRGTSLIVSASIGEDFNFYQFVGAPRYGVNPSTYGSVGLTPL